MVFNSAAMAASIASKLRALALRSRVLSLAKACSIGFRSGLYLGKKNSLAPTLRIAHLIAGVPVTAEVVHHDDVAWPQGGDQELLNPGEEAVGIDRSIEQARRRQTVTAQSRDEGERLTPSVRNLGDQTLAFGATAVRAGHIGLDPRLIDEIQSCRRNLALMGFPLSAPPGDIGAILLTGAQALFLKLSPA